MSVAKRPASTPRELTRVADRLSFVYLERCTLHREANAVTVEDAEGTRHIPSATIGTLLLGPGTRVTHQAMCLLGESGAGVVWVGEHGVRYYAAGRALTRSAELVQAQATAWANRATRLDVARQMFRLRFPDADPGQYTRRMILGKEGDRVKECYRRESVRTGVAWHGRHFVPGDLYASDPPNQGITAAAQCMYGVAHAVITALGCSPGLGFVHSGHELSFVMDIADLYKTELGIPVAFEVAAEGPEDVPSRTRRALRDRINEQGLLERCVRDLQGLLLPEDMERELADATDEVRLHSDHGADVPSGWNLGTEPEQGDEYWEVTW
ncbi:type I-E CRISPR-associated endonuclease Cas1e [Lipingzhangella sp. LS1_29]|uniref:CRISPR-associated endonuclease Cas1 n=1 Tax=Lipingzhangella rawalii TaxID=2055835 RepID=A0ABU2HAA7_9ACTN|nr:type I-E CRISPR-associated endonuclease Cas1e [Lipingzhangella rawalii]MDS1272261.1 type I-E CRISPR-associated endonuclease Cas1e [Lipingzhangella rawalii]